MDWGSLFLSFILTIIAYLAFPIIKLLMNQGKFEKKRAKRIALWNSIVVGAIFCIITIATSDVGNTWNAAPAVLYYFINCAILTEKNAHPEVAKNNNTKLESSEQYTVHPPQISDVDEVPKTHGNYNVFGSDIMLQKDDFKTTVHENLSQATKDLPKIQFCRKCGNKLTEDSLFCNKCGTKII